MNDIAFLKFFQGLPYEFKNVCLVYPPRIKDIGDDFGFYRRILTYSQEEVEDEFVERKISLDEILTPLEFILNNAFHSKEVEQKVMQAFTFFIHEPVFFLYPQKKIIIGDITKVDSVEKLRFLDEENFFDFQNLIRLSVGEKEVEKPNPNEHPRIKAMKAKARYRDKIKAKKGKGLNLRSSLVAICCMGLGLNPLNIGELSYVSIADLMNTYQAKEKYEIDIRSLQAGAKKKDVQPKYWIQNLE